MPQAKTEVALQFSECCAAETALQHSRNCSAEVIWTKSCAAANEKLHCNIEKAAFQESGAFLPLSCGFQVPTFRHPRLGPAEGKNRHKGGCKRLFAFVHVCSRLLACVYLRFRLCVCLRLSAFVCVRSHFAYPPLCCAPLCVTLIEEGGGTPGNSAEEDSDLNNFWAL